MVDFTQPGPALTPARWRSAAPEQQLVVAVNLSAEQFADRDLVDHVRGALAAADHALYRAKAAGKGRWAPAYDLTLPLPFPPGAD